VIVLLSTPRFLKTKVVLSVSAHSTNPIAKYDEGTHKTAGAAFLVVFSITKGNTMNQRTGIGGEWTGAVEGWVEVTVAGDGSRDLLTSAGQNGRRMQRRDARHAVEVGRVRGENIGVEQVRGHR
jgi:hypothetical protein